MRFVTPQVNLIAKSEPDPEEIKLWLESIGCSQEIVDKYTKELSAKTSGEGIVELAGRRCYMAFQPGLNPNVSRIRTGIREYCENILAQKHGSVLEHVTFTFAIEGVSRVFTGEMNRHRAGVAISEGSMRYIRYNDIPFVSVPSLTPGVDDNDVVCVCGHEESNHSDAPGPPYGRCYDECECECTGFRTVNDLIAADQHDFVALLSAVEATYQRITDRWAHVFDRQDFNLKKQLTSRNRRIIPMGVATGGVWTMNLRALRHVCTMRCSPAAEEEIAIVAGLILERMMSEEPVFFVDFTIDDGYWKPKYDKV